MKSVQGNLPIQLNKKTENFMMKKILVLIMALVMALSLVACGGGDAPEAPIEQQQEVSDANEKGNPDADYAKLEGFLDRIIANYEAQQGIATLVEEVKSGQKEESALLDAYKNLADDASGMLQDVQSTQWETNNHDDKVTALADCAEALVAYLQTLYEAADENDATKLETAAELAADYDEKLTAVLDAMGVE